MASISKESNGRRTIQFFHPKDGRRRSLRLGKVDQKTAQKVHLRVECLVSALNQGVSVDDETARWLAGLDDAFRDRLVAVGLATGRPRAFLKHFLDEYLQMRSDVKPATITVWKQTRGYLIEFFGESKLIREITVGDAKAWRVWLGKRMNRRDKLAPRTLSPTTINKRVGFAKQFFKFAVDSRLISENPFAELKSRNLANRERDHFISRETAEKVLAACPDFEWQLIFALSRFAGLRCPSEHLQLRWCDIDWAEERMTVRSPKTEHHDGKDSRVVPIFPELRPYLDAVWDEAERGAEFVITRYRDSNANLRTQFLRIIERAGLEPWPKLFHNLRATRQTELEENHPTHVVCYWLGNSVQIARKHYLQVTEAHYAKALQKAVHHTATSAHMEPHDGQCEAQKNQTCTGNAELAFTCTSDTWRIGDSNP